MAAVSISMLRSLAGSALSSLSDSQVGQYAGISAAVFYGVSGKEVGHIVESLSQVGANVELTAYGHLLKASGKIMISGVGGAIEGVQDFTRVDGDTIRIDGITLDDSEVIGGSLFRSATGDFNVIDNVIKVLPGPIFNVAEIRVERAFRGEDSGAFDDDTILEPINYYVPASASPLFKSGIELRHSVVREPLRRRPGFINAQYTPTRRVARVTYYVGTDDPLPADLLFAIADMAKQIHADPSGLLSSESIDYYSYSRRSPSELQSIPSSALATFLRYRG